MGIWKQQELEEMTSDSYKAPFCAGIAKLTIPETGEVFEVSPDDLDWESYCADSDRGMGAELHHYATVVFESEQEDYQVEATWNIWEYPIGAINYTNTEVEGGELLQDFDFYQLPHEDYTDEEQLDAILSNTEFFHTFFNEISSLRVLNSLNIADTNAQRTLKRQIFISAVTCLETYLSDAFINTVLSNQVYLKSFFSSFKDFKDKKLGMDELFSYVDKAEEIAKKAMLEVIYHNLPKVSGMYKSTFDIAFPDFSAIQRYIITRHDLVHRNGKTKEGKEIDVDEVFVDKIINTIESFVNELDRQLKEK
ncbi:MAG: HEPN domain-containing protein [Nostocaceae cyanobacterium]|nr:HEPN domain-containing protein [Nostocaceae cyanobacterium]